MSTEFPSQVYLREYSDKDIETGIKKLFSEPIIPEVQERHKYLNMIIHGPYSTPHFVKVEGDMDEENRPVFNNISEQLLIDGFSISIPVVNEIASEEVSMEINRYAKLLNIDKELLKNFIGGESKLYGEYWPKQIGFEIGVHDGLSLDSKKFLAAFLLKTAYEKKQSGLVGDVYTVLHTDSLIFSVGLEKGDIRDFISEVNSLVGSVGLKVVFENNQPSSNKAFRESLFWTYDPIEMLDFFGELPENIGLCVDIKHMLESGFTSVEILERVRTLHSQGVSLVIHSRDKYVNDIKPEFKNEYQEIMSFVYGEAIPVAYEPDSE